jgi:hypothetical protein
MMYQSKPIMHHACSAQKVSQRFFRPQIQTEKLKAAERNLQRFSHTFGGAHGIYRPQPVAAG